MQIPDATLLLILDLQLDSQQSQRLLYASLSSSSQLSLWRLDEKSKLFSVISWSDGLNPESNMLHILIGGSVGASEDIWPCVKDKIKKVIVWCRLLIVYPRSLTKWQAFLVLSRPLGSQAASVQWINICWEVRLQGIRSSVSTIKPCL